MAVLDPNEIMFRAFEPKVQNRFIMYMDNIPSFMVKTVSAPSFEDGEVVLDHINSYRKIRGKRVWNDMDMTLYDPITPSGAQIVMEEIRKMHESVTGRDGYSDMFMKDVTVELLGPTNEVVEKWTYKGAWILSAGFGDLDWSEEATPMMISITLQYNYAVLQF